MLFSYLCILKLHTATVMDNPKYDVFISYSRKDYVDDKQNVIPGNVVSAIKGRLAAEGISYWFDEEGIYSGQNFIEKIVTNIELSEIFVFLSSANANQSKYTCKEIASADEMGKHIIPVRIDEAPYNKKVMFRIADLDYISLFLNPQKGMDDLVDAIRKRLKETESERTKRLKEQQVIIDQIHTDCDRLNNEETKLDIDRENLILTTNKLTDEKKRKELVDFIVNSSPIRRKSAHNDTAELENATRKLAATEAEKNSLAQQADKLRKELEAEKRRTRARRNSKMHWIYCTMIVLLVAASGFFYTMKEHQYLNVIGDRDRELNGFQGFTSDETSLMNEIGEDFLYEKNNDAALRWFNIAAFNGSSEGLNNKGRVYYRQENYDMAMKFFGEAADRNNAAAQNNIGQMYLLGRGVKTNYKEAFSWFNKAAKGGNAAAQYNVGYMYEHGWGTDKDNDMAVQWYRKAADNGSSDAQERLKGLGINN